MKAYIYLYLIASAVFAAMIAIALTATIFMFSFVFWISPLALSYILLLRISMVFGLGIACFYIVSPEAKATVKYLQRIWK